MMNIIDFFKEFEFIKRRRLRSLGGAKICSGGCEYMLRWVRKLRGVRPVRGAPPETASDYINMSETFFNDKKARFLFSYRPSQNFGIYHG